jgi:hypothetical protein
MYLARRLAIIESNYFLCGLAPLREVFRLLKRVTQRRQGAKSEEQDTRVLF